MQNQAIVRATMHFFFLAKVNEFSKSNLGRPLQNGNDGAEKINEPTQTQTRESARLRDLPNLFNGATAELCDEIFNR